VAAVAVESHLELEDQPRVLPWRPTTAWPGRDLIDEREPPTRENIKPWELHSELSLVCTEVRDRARELLPERDPHAFLARTRKPDFLPGGMAEEAQPTARLSAAVFGYTLWRVLETARIALFAVGGVVALALLAEVLH
jgi:hypothetical protein